MAQFQHRNDRLDLGRDGRMLFAFHCENDPGMCDDWEAFSGANACFVLEPEELEAQETPFEASGPHSVGIAAWIEREDGLPESLVPHFRSDKQHTALPDETHARVTWDTRIGGFPKWLQSAEEAPQGWEFVAQLADHYSFYTPPLRAHSWIEPLSQDSAGRTHIAQGPNFGLGGVGYILLLRNGSRVPDGCFFWQQ